MQLQQVLLYEGQTKHDISKNGHHNDQCNDVNHLGLGSYRSNQPSQENKDVIVIIFLAFEGFYNSLKPD